MKKIFEISDVRVFMTMYHSGARDYADIVDKLNRKANVAVAAEKQRWVEKINDKVKYLLYHKDFVRGPEYRVEELTKLLEGEK